MEPPRAGLFSILKDKSRPWPEKLQTAREAWHSPKIFIPNKKQALIDWLVGVLLNRRKNQLDKCSRQSTWECLEFFLRSSCSNDTQKKTCEVHLKPNLLQIACEDMGSDPSEDKAVICQCCYVIVSSVSLSEVLFLNFSSLVKLTASCCTLVNSQVNAAFAFPVLEILTNKLLKALRQQGNIRLAAQLLVDQLLPAAVPVLTQHQDNEQKEVCARLSKCIHDILFHREHLSAYDASLQIMLSYNDKQSLAIKFIGDVFDLFVKALSSGEVATQQAYVNYLPQYYAAFLEAKHEEHTVPFSMLQYLCHLLALKKDRTGAAGIKGLPLSLAVACCSGLLDAAEKHDVYRMAHDRNQDGKRLSWLRVITAALLALDDELLHASWFKCLNCLLSISYSVIEPHLADLWKRAWLTSQVHGEAQRSQDVLLCSLISTYEKLRQMPKFIEGFLAALRQSAPVHSGFSSAFLTRFAAAVQAAPTSCVLEMWHHLLADIEENLFAKTDNPENRSPNLDSMNRIPNSLELIAELLYCLMRNARLFDATVTRASRDNAKALMVRMDSQLIAPIFEDAKHRLGEASTLYALAMLLLSWADVAVLFCTFAHEALDGTSNAQVWEPHTSLMAALLSIDKIAAAAGEAAQKEGTSASRLAYVQVMLRLQRVRTMLRLCDSSDPMVQSDIHRDISSVLAALESSGTDAFHHWDGRMSSIVEDNVGTAVFKAVVDYLPMCAPYIQEPSHWMLLACLLSIQAADDSHHSQDTGLIIPNGVTGDVRIQTIASGLMQSAIFPELKTAHGYVITAIIEESARRISRQSRKSKRSKISSLDCALECAMNLLLEDKCGDSWSASESAGVMVLEAAVEWCSKLDKSMHDVMLSKREQRNWLNMLGNHMTVMAALPLEYLGGWNTARCLVYGLVTLRLWTNAADNRGEESLVELQQLTVLPRCLECLTRLFTANHHHARSLLPLLNICRLASLIAHASFLVPREMPLNGLLPGFIKSCCTVDAATLPSSCALIDQQVKCLDKLIDAAEIAEPAEELILLDVLLLRVSNVVKNSQTAGNEQGEVSQLCSRSSRLQDKIINAMHCEKLPPQLSYILLNCYSTVIYSGHAHSTELLSAVTKKCLKQLLGSQDCGWLVASLKFITLVADKHHGLMKDVEQELGIDAWSYICQLHYAVQTSILGRSARSMPQPAECRDGLAAWHRLDDSDVIRELKHSLFRVPPVEEHLRTMLQKLIMLLVPGVDHDHLRASITTWEVVLECHFSNEIIKMLSFAAQALIMAVQNVACSMSNCMEASDNITDSVSTAVAIINLTSKVIEHDPPLLHKAQQASACLLGVCALEDLLLLPDLQPEQFEALCTAVYRLLNALLIWYTESVYGWVPLYVSHCNKLLVALIARSDQDAVLLMNKRQVEAMATSAQLVTRLFTLMSTHKADFNKVAPYIVANYTSSVQKVTVWPEIKKCLLLGIYKLLDICDEHAVALLHAALEAASKEIFRKLYEDYKHHHKYTGRV